MESMYAQALWKAIQQGTEPSQAVSRLNKILQTEGRAALWPKIAFAFKQLAARNRAKSGLTLTVADKKHEAQAHKAALASIAKLALDSKEIVVRIDDSLIGGWRLEGQELLIDASYKKDLLTIYQAVTETY